MHCAGDEDLQREVESLLAYEGKAESFMEVPALKVVVKQLAEKQALRMVQKSGTKLGRYEILAPQHQECSWWAVLIRSAQCTFPESTGT